MDSALQQRIEVVLVQWHEAGRAAFERSYENLDYDSESYAKFARDRNRYVALDEGHSGAFLLDKSDGNIYRLKSKYGVPNFKKLVGNIATIDGAQLSRHRSW